MAQAPKKPMSHSMKNMKASQPAKVVPKAMQVAPKAMQAVTKVAQVMPKIVEKTMQSTANVVKTVDKVAETAKSTMATMEATRNSAKSVVNMSTDTMKDMFSNTTGEAQKSHAKVFAMSRESTENVARMVESCTKSMNDTVGFMRSSMEVMIEVCNIMCDVSKSANAELISCMNCNFADNLDIINEICSCRDINDMMEIQDKCINMNLDNCFNQMTKFSDMCFQFSSEASEPLVEHITESTERFSKSLAA